MNNKVKSKLNLCPHMVLVNLFMAIKKQHVLGDFTANSLHNKSTTVRYE